MCTYADPFLRLLRDAAGVEVALFVRLDPIEVRLILVFRRTNCRASQVNN
jgi:hypothetical protein